MKPSDWLVARRARVAEAEAVPDRLLIGNRDIVGLAFEELSLALDLVEELLIQRNEMIVRYTNATNCHFDRAEELVERADAHLTKLIKGAA